MTFLERARDVIGRPVVAIDEADAVAEVKDVVVSQQAAAVVGFTLNRRGLLGGPMKEVLPWRRVHALGRVAVMIDDRGALQDRDEAMEEAAAEARERDVIGAMVVTDAGRALGAVVDVVLEVDDAAARVVGFEVRREDDGRDPDTFLIPHDDTIAVSGSTLLVPAAAESFLRDDLTGFGAAVADFRARVRQGAT